MLEIEQPVSEVAAAHVSKVKVTNRDRVIFPESNVTKGQLADYYTTVAPITLPGSAAGRSASSDIRRVARRSASSRSMTQAASATRSSTSEWRRRMAMRSRISSSTVPKAWRAMSRWGRSSPMAGHLCSCRLKVGRRRCGVDVVHISSDRLSTAGQLATIRASAASMRSKSSVGTLRQSLRHMPHRESDQVLDNLRVLRVREVFGKFGEHGIHRRKRRRIALIFSKSGRLRIDAKLE